MDILMDMNIYTHQEEGINYDLCGAPTLKITNSKIRFHITSMENECSHHMCMGVLQFTPTA